MKLWEGWSDISYKLVLFWSELEIHIIIGIFESKDIYLYINNFALDKLYIQSMLLNILPWKYLLVQQAFLRI